MKKNLLFAGLVLAVAPVLAQEEEGPTRTDQDAKVIFEQNFEDDWDAWQSKKIDSITTIQYYKKLYTGSSVSSKKIWEDTTGDYDLGSVRTDTVIYLMNGVMTTDDSSDINGGSYNSDTYTIVDDGITGENVTRQAKFDEYGVNGGTHYFRWTSDSARGVSYSDGVVPNYRRNLFVRGIDIEDESSYRLTLYVKAKALGSTTPTFYADVMRGYFSSEKPFSMGLESDDANYKYNSTFEYKKTDFKDDEWEKVTFMTYYLNDSIANSFVFINGYWWTDYWKWTDENGDVLQYIQQPDKYFVRLSFASDSTIFCLDNLSLTKSWIGGVEYYKDLIRVDFGYETDLNDLAEQAYNKNFISAVVLPGEYFKVWGLNSTWGEWEEVPIRTAEYHGDGYMYMWTQPDEYEGMEYARLFDEYDSVLVSFTNPVDRPDLCLHYTGSMFPKALDIDWIKAGKVVPNFYNEIATQNPNISTGVYSMSNLPPVLQGGITAEIGSFQLDGTIRDFTFKYSTKLEYDDKGEASELALMHVEKAGVKEVWTVKSVTDTSVTFTRPAKYTEPLSGDYEFSILQVKGKVTNYGEDRTVEYSFGPAIKPSGMASLIDFSSVAASTSASTNMTIDGFSLERSAYCVPEFTGLYTKALVFGPLAANTNASSGANCPKLFYEFEIPAAGNYDIEIGSSGYGNGAHNEACKLSFIVYDADGNQIGETVSREASSYKPANGSKIEAVDVDRFTITDVQPGTYKLAMTLPNEGSYGTWSKVGRIIYYIKIVDEGFDFSLSYPTMSAFDKAQTALNDRIKFAEGDADQYTGVAYDAAVKAAADYKNFNVTKLETAPSVWKSATNALADATGVLNSRIDVVDAMWAQYNASLNMIAEYDSLSEVDGANYAGLQAYKDLVAACEEYESFICKDKTDDSIKAVQAIYEAAQKALTDRKAINDSYNKYLAKVAAILSDSAAQKGTDEFADLQTTYGEYESYNIISAANDQVSQATSLFMEKLGAYNTVIEGVPAMTVRLKAFAQLAKDLGCDVPVSIESAVEAARDDDAELVKYYKLLVKAKVYDKLAAGNEDSLVLTPFINNYNLYSIGKVGSEFEHYSYTYAAPNNRWRVKGGVDHVNTLFPGWTVNSTLSWGASTNVHAASETRCYNDATEGYEGDPTASEIFDGSLAVDWNSSVTLTGVEDGIPAGLYQIGLNVKMGLTGNSLTVATDDQNSKSVTFDKESSFRNQYVDSVAIEDGNATITLQLNSGAGWSYADNFFLVLRGKVAGFDYAGEAATARQEAADMVTFVDGAQADAQVEYYGLDGIKAQAVKAGQINIKVTKKANGQRIIEKVLVK